MFRRGCVWCQGGQSGGRRRHAPEGHSCRAEAGRGGHSRGSGDHQRRAHRSAVRNRRAVLDTYVEAGAFMPTSPRASPPMWWGPPLRLCLRTRAYSVTIAGSFGKVRPPRTLPEPIHALCITRSGAERPLCISPLTVPSSLLGRGRPPRGQHIDSPTSPSTDTSGRQTPGPGLRPGDLSKRPKWLRVLLDLVAVRLVDVRAEEKHLGRTVLGDHEGGDLLIGRERAAGVDHQF